MPQFSKGTRETPVRPHEVLQELDYKNIDFLLNFVSASGGCGASQCCSGGGAAGNLVCPPANTLTHTQQRLKGVCVDASQQALIATWLPVALCLRCRTRSRPRPRCSPLPGRIKPRRQTRLKPRLQSRVARTVKLARQMALIPYEMRVGEGGEGDTWRRMREFRAAQRV